MGNSEWKKNLTTSNILIVCIKIEKYMGQLLNYEMEIKLFNV